MSHTKLPWQINQFDQLQICDSDGEKRGCAPICEMTFGSHAERKANAKFIVLAANCHEDLTAALEKAIRIYEHVCAAGKWEASHLAEYEECKAALAKACA